MAIEKEDATTNGRVSENQRERLLRVLSAATFLIFFQIYMVAPLIPRLSSVFKISEQTIGLIIPAFMIPYGVSTLFYGLLSDRLGRRRIMLASLLTFAVLTALTATAQSASQMILWRLLTGLGASGFVPLALALMGDLFPYERRGRPLGWLFGAMAGGMAFGSTFGVLMEPFVGWPGLFPRGRYPWLRGAGPALAISALSGRQDASDHGKRTRPAHCLRETTRTWTGAADLRLCVYQRGLPLGGLHVGWSILHPALRSRGGWYRPRDPWVRCPGLSARPDYQTSCRSMGTEVAGTYGPRNRCNGSGRSDP